MGMELLVLGQMSAETMVPLLAAVAIGMLVAVIFIIARGGSEKTDARLKQFSELSKADKQQGQSVLEPEKKGGLRELIDKASEQVAKPMQGSEKEAGKLQAELTHAGFRGENAMTVFLGIKFASLILALIAGFAVFRYLGPTKMGLVGVCLAAGSIYFAPSFILGYLTKKRKEGIFYGLPDALDLMVVCVEAGLGLDAAMRKVCEEMGDTYPIIAEEFSVCNFQLQMGRPRREVLHDLGQRTGVDDMKALAAILIQADRFGSSIAQALRVQSDSMRLRRSQEAEERAAKTAVKLMIPLILFIFPAVFIVLVGPAAVRISETFAAMEK